MTEINEADLLSYPSTYQSYRPLHGVLVGEDDAAALIKASTSGNNSELKNILSVPEAAKLLSAKHHRIYQEDRPSESKTDVRGVTARIMSNIETAVQLAAEAGQAESVSTLINFAKQNGIEPSTAINRYAVDGSVKNGHAGVVTTLASFDKGVLTYKVGHGIEPLDIAVQYRQAAVVKALLEAGADWRPSMTATRRGGSYRISLLSKAVIAGPDMVESLIKHGAPVASSGALHQAAERGKLDVMELLIKHGADVNELLPKDTLSTELLATWTPSHFAASSSHIDALELLKSHGARSDLKDANGKTAAQLLLAENK